MFVLRLIVSLYLHFIDFICRDSHWVNCLLYRTISLGLLTNLRSCDVVTVLNASQVSSGQISNLVLVYSFISGQHDILAGINRHIQD